MSDIFDLRRGPGPLLISVPHCGIGLMPGLERRLAAPAQALPDTDWHVPRLYAFAEGLGASMISARFSRYVIDLNRPPDGASLYPGQATTGLCPTTLFDGTPLYLPGQEPDEAEIAARREQYWRPYHAALAAELARIRAAHGHALLFDAHSIASRMPRLFEGRLPDLNLGTARGASCPTEIGARLLAAATGHGYSAVLDGRFVGGHITRHYGRPAEGVLAVQLELAQIAYMEEGPPFAYDETKASRLVPVLKRILETYIAGGS
ncbi:MAG: N-formylglutamate deformylase [Alphaproteobacteria bacterium]|nr:N-formylglutamate deformylase [Alphaproteobacteria bacterium]